MRFARFMSGVWGRGVRILLGATMILFGAVRLPGGQGVILVLLGVVPLIAGVANVCIVGRLIGAPFRGRDAAHSEVSGRPA